MKYAFLFYMAFSMLMISACKQEDQQQNRTETFQELLTQFKAPGKHYGSAPLWVWNAEVTKGKIDTQLQAFKKNAFGGVFVHPRPGLITPYLSEKWLDLYQYTVAKGRELGLDVWIYDENSYPSGFAGGHVPEEMPSSYNQGQMLNLEKATKVPAGDTSLFLVLAQTAEGFKLVDPKDTGSLGDYYLFRKEYYGQSPWYGGYSYVDLMVKGVTEKFIDITMKGYEKAFGDAFGNTVPGIFTDEPNIEVQGEHNIRWTPDLFAAFQERWGYDLRTHLPSLYEEVGDWKKVRHNYYQVLLQLFIDRWSKPWQAYTDKKHLEWTGHYWEHGWPNPNHGGDNMAMYAWHQRPAIDMLFNQFDEVSPNAQFGNIRSVKELASVANQLGKKRTLSETYGGGGWELRFQDMKRLGDWEFVLGVNTLNQHLSYMTMVGARKYDYPQSFSYHSPWWSYYKSLNEYFARLSLALSSGKQVNQLLILEPTSSTWMYSTYRDANPRRDEIGRNFQSFITKLEKTQVEYDLGSENIIKDHGDVKGKEFVIGERAYSQVILPPGMENLDQATFDLLNSYVQGGGKLITFEQVRYIDGTAAPKKLEAINRYKVSLNDLSVKMAELLPADLRFSPADTLGKLYHHRRILSDGELVFLVNSSLHEAAKGNMQMKRKYVYLLDLQSGAAYRYPVESANQVDYHIPPAGSSLLFFSDQQYDALPQYHKAETKSLKVINTPTQVHFLEPNVLTIDFCDVHIGDTVLQDKQVYHASDTVFKYFGFLDGNPWNTSVQFQDNTIKRDTFPKGLGFQVDYHFHQQAGVDKNKLQLALERPWLWKVLLNGKEIQADTGWYLDRDIKTFTVGPFVKDGDNTVSLVANRMRVHAEIEPIYILGNFNLKSKSKGWDISPSTDPGLGSWKTLGRPMYGNQASYIKKINAEEGKQYQLELGQWEGTAAEVMVNGEWTADISYPPYRTLLPKLKQGTNTIEVRVVGSLKNTLGPHHNQPKPGMVSPWLWRGVQHYPSGKDYQTYDYGLFEDYKVREVKRP